MFGGFGWPEAAVLVLLGLFIFGPERLPGVAQDVGRALRKARVYLKSMGEDLKAELGPEMADIDLKSLDPKQFVRKHLFEDEVLPEPSAPERRATLVAGERPPWDPDTT